jgi:hypothetical protein
METETYFYSELEIIAGIPLARLEAKDRNKTVH